MDKSDVTHLKALRISQSRELKDLSSRLLSRDMIFDNIKDLIPAECVLTKNDHYTGRIFIKFKDETEDTPITVDRFEKVVKKLAKKFRKEPSVYVNEATLEACWFMRVVNGSCVYVELTCGNTEKCDFITVTKEVTETEAVGYCAILKQKKFLES
jgi:hypothetical protein